MELRLLEPLPKKIQDKILTREELLRYFGDVSIHKIISMLQYGQEQGYFSVELSMKDEKRSDNDDLAELIDRISPTHDEAFVGAFAPTHNVLPRFVKPGVALSRQDMVRIARLVPKDMLNTRLRFKLTDIDYDKLKPFIKPKSQRPERYYKPLKYKGLEDNGVTTKYLGKSLYLPNQHRQVLRMFMEKPEKLIYRESFIDNREVMSKEYNDPYKTLGKLIPAVHKTLRNAVKKDCIHNSREKGWTLKIE